MINLENFDKKLGAMVRDPLNADKTASEILDEHEAQILKGLKDDNYSDTLKYAASIFAICILLVIGVLLCPI